MKSLWASESQFQFSFEAPSPTSYHDRRCATGEPATLMRAAVAHHVQRLQRANAPLPTSG